jgi:hypothetical protein
MCFILFYIILYYCILAFISFRSWCVLGAVLWDESLEAANTAKYQRNTLVWFVNSRHSVHSVTPREPTTFR